MTPAPEASPAAPPHGTAPSPNAAVTPTAAAPLERAATQANGLAAFFARERRRADRHVALPLALLSSHGLRYLLARGSIVFTRVPLRTALHLAEVVVLADVLEFGVLGQLLAIRSVVAAFGAFHWGALEPLRASVRDALAAGQPHAAEWEIARYLRLAVDFCIAELLFVVLFLEFGPRPYASFSIYDTYVIGCGLRVMAETITRTYHAGAFALRRVRRPVASILGLDLVDVGTVLVLWPWLGFWGFGIAQLAGGVVEAALALLYTRRTYSQLPINAPTLAHVLSDRARAPFTLLRDMIAPGVGNLAAQVDAVLITALALGTPSGGLGLAAGLHVLRPVLSLGSGWARLFYFDLTHLRASVRGLFRARFERLLLLAAPCFAVASLVVAVLIAFVSSAALFLPVIATLAPFLVVRSAFAATQIQAFARGAYGILALGGALVLATALLVPRLHPSSEALLAATTLALALAGFLFFWGARRIPAPDPPDSEPFPLPPLSFVGRLARAEGPVRVHVLTLNAHAAVRAMAVTRALNTTPGVPFVSRFSRRTLLVASTDTAPSLRARFVAQSGGSLADISSLAPEPSGRHALAALLKGRLLDLSADTPLAVAALRARFMRDFPEGTLLDATSGALPRAAASARQLALSLRELGDQASGLRPARRRGLRAAVYAPYGEAECVFFAGRDTDPARFAEFERAAFEASLRATLDSVSIPRKRS